MLYHKLCSLFISPNTSISMSHMDHTIIFPLSFNVPECFRKIIMHSCFPFHSNFAVTIIGFRASREKSTTAYLGFDFNQWYHLCRWGTDHHSQRVVIGKWCKTATVRKRRENQWSCNLRERTVYRRLHWGYLQNDWSELPLPSSWTDLPNSTPSKELINQIRYHYFVRKGFRSTQMSWESDGIFFITLSSHPTGFMSLFRRNAGQLS